MAKTFCLSCDKTYLEQEEVCPNCGKSADQQLFWDKYTPFRFKIGFCFKKILEVIFY